VKRIFAAIFFTFLAYGISAQTQNPTLSQALTNYFKAPPGPRSTLVVIYMAARNDLSIFAERHIRQLQNLGSTDQVKIFVHLDTLKTAPGFHTDSTIDGELSRNFFIDKNRLLQIGPEHMQDSGKKETLIETVKTAYSYFPAEEVVLILWNHGHGPIEAVIQNSEPYDMWRIHSSKETVDLDDSIGYLDRLTSGEFSLHQPKGICSDDVTGSYLTISDLTEALRIISQEVIKKKIGILACDACTMAGADVFCGLSPYVKYFVASQEVEMGLGYKYDLLMKPLLSGIIRTPSIFACHFVNAYKEFYSQKMDYYTHCAIDLAESSALERNIDELSLWLILGLEHQHKKTIKDAIRLSRHKNHCIRFNEPTFLDLGNLYRNLLKNLHLCTLTTPEATEHFRKSVSSVLTEGINLIKKRFLQMPLGKNTVMPAVFQFISPNSSSINRIIATPLQPELTGLHS
jgi:hypothetical protein